MREIKFRAWDGEKMVEVAELHLNTKELLVDDEEWLSMQDSPLMQYTGLHDKDGRELYEGDIVEAYIHGDAHGDLYEVTFDGGAFDFKLLHTPNAKHPYAAYDYPPECKLLGNIYENPELMEVAEHE